jgi:hypothetical protein
MSVINVKLKKPTHTRITHQVMLAHRHLFCLHGIIT